MTQNSDRPKIMLIEGVFSKDTLGITEKELERVYKHAKQLYDAGKFEESLTLFSTLVFLDSINPVFLYGFGASYFMLKKYDQAAEAFLEYAGLIPDDPLPYFFIAECYEKKQDRMSTMIALQALINTAGDRPQYQEMKNRALMVLEGLKNKACDKVTR